MYTTSIWLLALHDACSVHGHFRHVYSVGTGAVWTRCGGACAVLGGGDPIHLHTPVPTDSISPLWNTFGLVIECLYRDRVPPPRTAQAPPPPISTPLSLQILSPLWNTFGLVIECLYRDRVPPPGQRKRPHRPSPHPCPYNLKIPFGIPSSSSMLYDIYYSMHEYEGNVREKVNEFHIYLQ